MITVWWGKYGAKVPRGAKLRSESLVRLETMWDSNEGEDGEISKSMQAAKLQGQGSAEPWETDSYLGQHWGTQS